MRSSADPSSDRLRRLQALRRSQAIGAAALVAFIGAAIVVSPWYERPMSTRGASVAVVGGLSLIALAAVLFVARGMAPRTAGQVVQTPDGLDLRLRRVVPIGRLVVGVAVGAFFIVSAVALGGGGYVLMLPAVGLLLLVPDAVIGLTRRAHLRLTSDGIDYRGWSLDAVLAWDDIEKIDSESPMKSQPRILLRARPTASWHHRSTRLVLPMDRKVRFNGFGLAHSAFDNPYAVEELLKSVEATPRAYRAALLTSSETAMQLSASV